MNRIAIGLAALLLSTSAYAQNAAGAGAPGTAKASGQERGALSAGQGARGSEGARDRKSVV